MRTMKIVSSPGPPSSPYPYKVEFYGSMLGIYARLRLLLSRVNLGTTVAGSDPAERFACHNGLLLLLGCRLQPRLGDFDLRWSVSKALYTATLPVWSRCSAVPEGPVIPRRVWVSKWRVWWFYLHFYQFNNAKSEISFTDDRPIQIVILSLLCEK